MEMKNDVNINQSIFYSFQDIMLAAIVNLFRAPHAIFRFRGIGLVSLMRILRVKRYTQHRPL
jgi:hypothetical protein